MKSRNWIFGLNKIADTLFMQTVICQKIKKTSRDEIADFSIIVYYITSQGIQVCSHRLQTSLSTEI